MKKYETANKELFEIFLKLEQYHTELSDLILTDLKDISDKLAVSFLTEDYEDAQTCYEAYLDVLVSVEKTSKSIKKLSSSTIENISNII